MANRSVVFFLIGCITLVYSTTVEIPDLGVILGSTTQSAWTNRTIHSFRSVKFGKSPSGSRRFAPPEAIEAWDGVYDATQQGIRCPHVFKLADLILNSTEDMEDCLSMNIFTPKIPDDNTNHAELLPVMVYIHGGGFYEGESKFFPPNYLLENDVLLVVPQYRLGPLGFLSLHTDNIPGNMAFMDQLLALKWVNKYIKHFGGDNSRVTVFGQSAGGASVSLMLLSPAVEPHLFQKMIVQSGSVYGYWGLMDDPVEYARDLYNFLTNSTEEVAVQEMEDAFRRASLIELLTAAVTQIKIDPTKVSKLGRAVVQKAGSIRYLTMTPDEAIESGKFRTVPMMAGVTKHDGSFYLKDVYDALKSFNLQDDDEFLRNNATNIAFTLTELKDNSGSLIDFFNNQYFKNVFDKDINVTFADIAPGLTDIFGMLALKGQTFKQAKINANYENITYVYTMDYRGEHSRFGYGEDMTGYPYDGGVHHSNDLLYLFPYHYETPLNENDTKFSKLITDLWTSFAIDTVPTSSQLSVEWPKLKKNKNGPYLHLNAESSIGDDFVYSEYFAATNEAKSRA